MYFILFILFFDRFKEKFNFTKSNLRFIKIFDTELLNIARDNIAFNSIFHIFMTRSYIASVKIAM